MANRNTAGLNTSPGTLNAPAGYGGASAVNGEVKEHDLTVLKAANSAHPVGRASASTDARSVLNLSATLVIAGTVLLWVLGGIVFKNANL